MQPSTDDVKPDWGGCAELGYAMGEAPCKTSGEGSGGGSGYAWWQVGLAAAEAVAIAATLAACGKGNNKPPVTAPYVASGPVVPGPDGDSGFYEEADPFTQLDAANQEQRQTEMPDDYYPPIMIYGMTHTYDPKQGFYVSYLNGEMVSGANVDDPQVIAARELAYQQQQPRGENEESSMFETIPVMTPRPLEETMQIMGFERHSYVSIFKNNYVLISNDGGVSWGLITNYKMIFTDDDRTTGRKWELDDGSEYDDPFDREHYVGDDAIIAGFNFFTENGQHGRPAEAVLGGNGTLTIAQVDANGDPIDGTEIEVSLGQDQTIYAIGGFLTDYPAISKAGSSAY